MVIERRESLAAYNYFTAVGALRFTFQQPSIPIILAFNSIILSAPNRQNRKLDMNDTTSQNVLYILNCLLPKFHFYQEQIPQEAWKTITTILTIKFVFLLNALLKIHSLWELTLQRKANTLKSQINYIQYMFSLVTFRKLKDKDKSFI